MFSSKAHGVPYKGPISHRDETIDIIRGYCILSMVAGHMAGDSLFSGVLHIFPQFDGASGFVLLSGLILGQVQRRRVDREGLRVTQVKTVRRAALVYAAQIFLGLLGLMGVLAGWRNNNYPKLEGMTVSDIIWNILLMNLAPPGADVLRLYVFFLFLAIGAYALLARGHWLSLLTLSLVLHLAAQEYPDFSSFSPYPDQSQSAGWAGWQLLFITALLVGWYWERWNAGTWISNHAGLIFLTGVVLTVVAALITALAPPAIEYFLFNKYTFPLGRVLAAYAVVFSLYVCLNWLLTRLPSWWFRILSMTGKRSLDSYIIQGVAVVLVFSFVRPNTSSLDSILLCLLTFVVCWLWAELRNRESSLLGASRQR